MVSSLVQKLRVICPIAASVCVATTVLTCLVIVKAKHIWVGGLVWPFFSDMGRDPPPYYVFCTGLTLTMILLTMTWFFNHQYHMMVLKGDEKATCTRLLAHLCCFTGIIATPGLPILAFFDTSTHTAIHHSAAYWFFYLMIVAVCSNTLVTSQIYAMAKRLLDPMAAMETGMTQEDGAAQRLQRRKKTLVIQTIFMVLFFISFLLYIPVGQALPGGPAPRLTIDQCLEEQLGYTYCTDTMRLNATTTTLFDSRKTFLRSQVRAAGQLGCILTLIGYSISFITNDYSSNVDESAVALKPVLEEV